ncbi:uncharacterized protein LOC125039828 [Penaeus chinensis]|uniref:uncharacterized protein LOC125039828 n=1 Tax=Penaeus chinensis TaxID=139456 RepID=UPI001FB6DB79|nr:uncharacterized protein LOC125039828 [Penaeus chinensis]
MGQRCILTLSGFLYLCLIFIVFSDLSLTFRPNEEGFTKQGCVTTKLFGLSRLPFTLPFSFAVFPSHDFYLFAARVIARDALLYDLHVWTKGDATRAFLKDQHGAVLLNENGLPVVRRSLQIYLLEDTLGFVFDAFEDEEKESAASGKDFISDDKQASAVSGQNPEAKATPVSPRQPLPKRNKSIEAKIIKFSLPEIDLTDISRVDLHNWGAPMKLCVYKGITSVTASTDLPAHSSSIKIQQANLRCLNTSIEEINEEEKNEGGNSDTQTDVIKISMLILLSAIMLLTFSSFYVKAMSKLMQCDEEQDYADHSLVICMGDCGERGRRGSGRSSTQEALRGRASPANGHESQQSTQNAGDKHAQS